MTETRRQLMQGASDAYWQHTGDMAFIKDVHGAYLVASRAFAAMVGYADPAALAGKTDFDFFADQELAKRYVDDDARLLQGGVSLENYVEPIASVNGRPRYSLTSKYILRDGNGAPAGIFGIGRDITVEYEARQNYESELRSLFSLPADAMTAMLLDLAAWRVVDVRYRDETNQVVSRFSRIDEYIEDVLAAIVDDTRAGDFYRGFSQKTLQEAYTLGHRNRSLEYLRRMPDGAERWVRDEQHLLLDPVNGNLSLIVILRDIDASRREYCALVQAAEQDTMTGLFNHDTTVKCIERYLADAAGQQALFMIDLDNFKQINDTFGHRHGDTVLADTAAAIRKVFRATDIVGRLGGDEFMVLMKNVSSEAMVRHKAEELLAALQFLSRAGDKVLELTTSVGVTLFVAGERAFGALYSEADAALYQSKRGGKNRYSLFEPACPERRAPASLLESVSTVQLSTLLEYMQGGVMLAEVTDDVRITYVSPSVRTTFGRSVEEVGQRGEALLSVVAPEDLPGLKAALVETAGNNAILDYSYRVVYADRTEWRHIRAKRIPESGDGIHRLVAVISDITGQKAASERLHETEQRYRVAVEQTDALLWEVDIPSRTLTLIGPGWAGYRHDRLVFPAAPDSYSQAAGIHPDSLACFQALFRDLYAGIEGNSYYLCVHDEKGRELWVKERFRLLRDGRGAPYCALGIRQQVPGINAEMHRFEQELRFVDIVRDTLNGYVRVNFASNRVEAAEMDCDARYGRFCGMGYDDYRRCLCAECVDTRDVESFSRQTAGETLLGCFRDGETWKFVDYRRLGGDGVARWVSLFVKLMRHPVSGDIYAFGYLLDNDARRGWELSFGQPLQRHSTLLMYAPESMAALARHVLAHCPADRLVAVSVFTLQGLDRLSRDKGGQEVREVLFTFGQLCRMTLTGEVIIGQLDENRIVLLRADAAGSAAQRERTVGVMARLKALLARVYPELHLTIMGGFALGKAGQASYDLLLKKAGIACLSASRTLDDAAVAYAESGVEPVDDTDGLAERCHELELRYQQLAHLLRVTEYDDLTGLLNRQAFYRQVREVLDTEPDRPYALIRFDINRFKVYNDVRGSAAGDRLLRDIAAGIRQCGELVLRSARLESDHFVLLVRETPEAGIGDRLLAWLAGYLPEWRISFTIGVYRILTPGLEVSQMCDRALLALRAVKSGFATRLGLYDSALRDRLLEEQQLVDDMAVALRDGQFELYFQPQINYENGALIGAEALVRWNHPRRGLLAPDVFIPLFEQNGLITRLDEYVWKRCCACLRDWTARFPKARLLSVSVNVSRLDIYDPDLCGKLKALVETYGLPPFALRLEITESAYMENQRQLIDAVQQLQHAGFVIEVDDFGTGYSSLNALKDVAIDVLKLDMKFLADCADSSRGGNILSSVIRMAHWLRLPIIAEGVETRAQADYLKSLGCIYMQGYYFERPLSMAAFEALLERAQTGQPDKYRDTNVEGVAAFWDASAQTALLFNSFVGGAAIAEYRSGHLEITRANDAYYKALGTTRAAYLPVQTDVLGSLDKEVKRLLIQELDRAMTTGEESSAEIRCRVGVGGVTRQWIRNRIQLLATNNGSAILYVSIEDITEQKRLERKREVEAERGRLLMQSTGASFFDYEYATDTLRYQLWLPGRGVEERSLAHCGKSTFQSPRLHPDSAAILRKVIRNGELAHVDGEAEFLADFWGTGLRWFRMRYASVEDADGRPYKLVGQAFDIHALKERAAQSEAIRHRLNNESRVTAFNEDIAEQIFSLFYATADIHAAIETTLALLGDYYDLSRAYIFEDADGHTAASNSFEWCAPGVDPHRDALQHIPYAAMGGRTQYVEKFDQSGLYYCPDVSLLPPAEQAMLQPQGIRSMLQYAICDNGVFSGLIGFDECRAPRRWTDEQVGTLMFVSRIIGAFLLRLRESAQAGFSADFRAALDDNAAYIYIIDPDTFEITYNNKAIQDAFGEDYVGQVCYREFIGRDAPCENCPVFALRDKSRGRLAEVKRADGMLVLSHASPLRWNGRNMAMLSCVDISEKREKP